MNNNIDASSVNTCNCELGSLMTPFCCTTSIFGVPIGTTIMCVSCRKKVKALTMKKAILKWNRRT